MKNVMRIPFLVFFFLLSVLPFRRRSLQPLVVALVLVVPACGGGGDITQSRGEFYEEMGAPACERIVVCLDLDPSEIDPCIDGFVEGACDSTGACSEVVTVGDADWSDCLSSFASHSCSALIDEGIFPSECRTIDQLF